MRKATPSKENALTKDRRSSLRLAVKNSAVVIVSLGVATAITELFYRLNLGPQNAILLFVLAIFLIAALTDGYLYCLCATAVGVFLFDFLITEPRLDFSYTIGFPISLIVMLTVATITSSITAKMRLSAMRAKEKEQQTEMLYQINDRLLSAQGDTRIAGEATSFIAQCLGRSSCVYWAPSEQPSLENGTFPYAAQDHVDVRIFYQEHVYAWVQSEMEKDNPQRAGGLNLAYPPILLFCFSAGKSVKGALAVSMQRGECSEEERQFLQLASVQLMQALRLDRLREQRQQAMIAAETEQSRNHFLRAVSHDLRTPLTSILGAGSDRKSVV